MSDQNNDSTRRGFLMNAGAGLLAAAVPATQLAPPDKQPPNLDVPEPLGKKVGWAIVGLGKLALEEVMPAFARCEKSRPVALVSGHPDKAKQVAERYGINPKSIYNYENYDTIKDNPEIQVVYNILPNHMHAEYTIRGHQAGKHVLCEKPMAATVRECEQMIDAAKNAQRKLMIGYRLRYEPYNQTAIEMARKKQFGEIKLIESSNVQDVQAPNIRLSKQTAGGPLGDVGVYCINACRYLTGEEPVEVTGTQHQPKDDPRFAEVPESVAFTLRFPSGVMGYCGCSFGGAESRRYRVQCAKGWFELDPAFAYTGLELHTSQEKTRSQINLPQKNHFAAEMDHLSTCILDNKDPLTPGEEGLADMKVMAAIEESVRTGKAVAVS